MLLAASLRKKVNRVLIPNHAFQKIIKRKSPTNFQEREGPFAGGICGTFITLWEHLREQSNHILELQYFSLVGFML